jgi:hypothetical protein
MTRVALRLWRKTAAAEWYFWPVRAYVSYANAIRHTGDIYRFDGWKKAGEVKGGTATARGKRVVYEPKSVWVYRLAAKAPRRWRVTRRRQVRRSRHVIAAGVE